jgi:hypothetical protein
MNCPACGFPSHGLDRCEVAARKRALTAPKEVNAAPCAVNEDAPAVNTNSTKKRGAYPGTEARREYMREKMRKRRSQEKRNG